MWSFWEDGVREAPIHIIVLNWRLRHADESALQRLPRLPYPDNTHGVDFWS
eukprot:m.47877 g.47877  ORF g.47877 m.47877 type:complete len:51 (-) comp15735_c0_seq1:194-346(-)